MAKPQTTIWGVTIATDSYEDAKDILFAVQDLVKNMRESGRIPNITRSIGINEIPIHGTTQIGMLWSEKKRLDVDGTKGRQVCPDPYAGDGGL